MMAPRHVLLRQPHMAHLLDHPTLDTMPHRELEALEAFMAFCAAEELDDPQVGDLRAFAKLRAQAPENLDHLAGALGQLGLPERFMLAAHDAAEELRHRKEFRGVSQAPRRSYYRTVSLPPDSLPADWQETLRRLRVSEIFAEPILDRMVSRLGMFAWSAQRGGHPVDLGCVTALQALYNDMRARSAAKNDGTPRWAYLRSTWEELRRFAVAHGLSQATCDRLGATYAELAQLEQQQAADKWAKVERAGTASGLLADAEVLLARASNAHLPHIRHARRNGAVAIAIGVGVPARPQDVVKHHVFGKGIYFEAGWGCYRFRYLPQKTRGKNPEPLDILLNPHWNVFIDALILQDQDSRYLGELRAQVISSNRPLYVNYDGSPCAYAWYSSAWENVAGTGGTIVRTLIYDEMADLGEFGIQYGRAANYHRSERIPAKYRSGNALRKSYEVAQNALIRRGCDDDISDLL